MRKNIFPKIFLRFFPLLLLGLIIFLPLRVFSQADAPSRPQSPTSCDPGQKLVHIDDPIYGSYDQCQKIPPAADQSADAAKQGDYGVIAKAVMWLASFILRYLFLYPVNWFLEMISRMVSFAFDYAVYFSIVKFKSNFGDLKLDIAGSGIGSALVGNSGGDLIYYIWGMIRDLLNIIIFLTIIYHAVQSMFEGFEDTRKKFISLLVFSIIVNFSLLFVKLSIDISNILALEAYTLAIHPNGTDSFANFQKVSSGPSSYGQYIRDKVSFAKLLTAAPTGTNSQNITITPGDDLNDTFMFQLGKMIVLIGLIYLMVYMTMMLFVRAGYLIYAMILSPLLAADIFFKIFEKENPTASVWAKSIRNITDTMRGDYYDALIKGPALLFFLFLIGVFASSIFSANIYNDIVGSAAASSGTQNLDSSFRILIFVLFKFALFFTLCLLTFRRLDSIQLFGEGGKHFNNFSRRLANYAIGKGFGAAGFAGRNYVSRPLANTTYGKRFLDGLSNSSVRLQQNTGLLSPVANRVGRLGASLERGLRTGSFDGRNTLYDEKGNPTFLGGAVSRAAGLLGVKDLNLQKELGKGAEGGYSEADKKRKAKEEAKVEKDIEAAVNARVKTQQDVTDAKNDANNKLKLGSSLEGTIAEIDGILKDPNFKNALQGATGSFSTTLQNGQQVTIQAQDIKGLKDMVENKKGEFQQKYNDTLDEAVAKKVQKGKDDVRAKMELQAEENKRIGGFKVLEKAKDIVSGANVVGEGGALAKAYQKKSLETQKENAKKSSIIKETSEAVKVSLEQANQVLNSGFFDINTPQGLNDYNSVVAIRDKLQTQYTTLQDPNYLPDDVDPNSIKSEKLDKFEGDKDFREAIVKNKKDLSGKLKSFFEPGAQNDVRFNDLSASISTLESQIKARKRAGAAPNTIRPDEDRLRNMKSMLRNKGNTSLPERIGNSAKSLEERYKTLFEPKVEPDKTKK